MESRFDYWYSNILMCYTVVMIILIFVTPIEFKTLSLGSKYNCSILLSLVTTILILKLTAVFGSGFENKMVVVVVVLAQYYEMVIINVDDGFWIRYMWMDMNSFIFTIFILLCYITNGFERILDSNRVSWLIHHLDFDISRCHICIMSNLKWFLFSYSIIKKFWNSNLLTKMMIW